MSILNSTWTWLCAGVGLTAITIVVIESPNEPEIPVATGALAPSASSEMPIEIKSDSDIASDVLESTALEADTAVEIEPEVVPEVALEEAASVAAPGANDNPVADTGVIPETVESADPEAEVVAGIGDEPQHVPDTDELTSSNAEPLGIVEENEAVSLIVEGTDIADVELAKGPESVEEATIETQVVAELTLEATEVPEVIGPDPNIEEGAPVAISAPAGGEPVGAVPSLSSSPQSPFFAAPLSLAQVLPRGEAPEPEQVAPSFDLVRVAPDGSAVIAGRAEPNAQVQIFSGERPVAEATASSRGEFVVFLSNPSEPTLDVQIPEVPESAQLVVSQDDIVILPTLSDAPDAAPLVLRRTPDAVQLVQPSGPAIPSNVSLDLVTYSAAGSVILAGRGHPENTARIYANGDLAGEVTIALGGDWRLEIDDIAEGRYVLRVDEIDPSGTVLSRAESPFQREFPEAEMPESFAQGAKIIVQPGNTLWLMATEAYGDGDAFTQIFSANSEAIRDPNLIYPGQIFSIPRLEE